MADQTRKFEQFFAKVNFCSIFNEALQSSDMTMQPNVSLGTFTADAEQASDMIMDIYVTEEVMLEESDEIYQVVHPSLGSILVKPNALVEKGSVEVLNNRN